MVDSAKIILRAGKGGDGRNSFIRTRYRPKGGPDGGNGGKGGDIYFIATHKINTLSLFRSQNLFKAQNGEMGGKNYKSGKSGEDLILEVPVGTVVLCKNKVLFDFSTDSQKELVLKGGRGGLGNAEFKSSTNQRPEYVTKGRMGEELEVSLELKLISNVGLIGFPSVGKSTLLNYLAQSSYKTASYPFTTLSPNLGVIHLKGERSLVLADLPGLIEGASSGKGLGDEFLKHTERCGILVHLLDFTQIENFQFLVENDIKELSKEIIKNYKIIRKELSLWSKNLENKLELVVLTKIDLLSESNLSQLIQLISADTKKEVIGLSAYTGEGIESLLNYFDKNYDEIIAQSNKSLKKIKKVKSVEITLKNIPNKRLVAKEKLFKVW